MLWIRYEYQGKISFGCLEDHGETIQPYRGTLFSAPRPQGSAISISEVKQLVPNVPSKMIALWNNYKALAKEKQLSHPETPLYLMKPQNSYLPTGETIRFPEFYNGEVFYEGELGIVIGKPATNLKNAAQAEQHIFGYTCINDVTAFGLLKDDRNFDQWTRAKGFDTFGVFGPAIATGLDPNSLEIITRVDGKEVQHYPASDMIFAPAEVVCLLSRNMTLNPGDVICCGTSIGLGPMPRGCTVEVEIAGIGKLENPYQ